MNNFHLSGTQKTSWNKGKIMPQPALILASASPYRRALLARLNIPYTCVDPDIDESYQAGETATDLVRRLATQKAMQVAASYPAAIIIGSDQIAVCDQEILTKPGDHATAVKQLQKLSGNTVIFHTGLCVMNTTSNTVQVDNIQVNVKFRSLALDEIDRYLQAEKPYDCVGSFKSEGYGITLVDDIQGHDQTALIGLPLIRLCTMLRDEKLNLP
jgi:septum formation protein